MEVDRLRTVEDVDDEFIGNFIIVSHSQRVAAVILVESKSAV